MRQMQPIWGELAPGHPEIAFRNPERKSREPPALARGLERWSAWLKRPVELSGPLREAPANRLDPGALAEGLLVAYRRAEDEWP